MISPLPITPSELTKNIPAIEQGAVTVTPASGSFASVIAANSGARHFLVQPGEYRGWAEETLDGLHGTAEAPYVIRYDYSDSATHPAQRANHALVNPIHFQNSEHVIAQGLTSRDAGTNWLVEGNPFYGAATDIIFDRILAEDSDHLYNFRVFSSRVTVQNTVVRNTFKSVSDTVAVQVKPFQLNAIVGFLALNNETFGVKDSYGFTQSGSSDDVRVSGVVIDNCDAYNEAGYRGWTENAIDVKTAPADGERNVIRNSRYWGHWPTSEEAGGTAAGDIIVFHQLSRRWDVEDCVFGDSVSGIRDEVFSAPYNQDFTTRDLAVRGSYFYRIQGGGTFNAGAIDLIHSATVEDSTFVECGYVLGAPIAGGYRDGGPTFARNTRINSPNLRCLGGHAGDNEPVPFGEGNFENNAHHAFSYYRRQWTGPELVEVTSGSQLQPRRYSPPSAPFVRSSLATKAGRPLKWRRR